MSESSHHSRTAEREQLPPTFERKTLSTIVFMGDVGELPPHEGNKQRRAEESEPERPSAIVTGRS
jgi:hypothetical protein